MPTKIFHYFMYSEESSDEESIDEESDDEEDLIIRAEDLVFHAEVEFLENMYQQTFFTKEPTNYHNWTKGKAFSIRKLFFEMVDSDTLDRIDPRKKGPLALGKLSLTDDQLDILFEFALRWTHIHPADVFVVAANILRDTVYERDF